MEIINQKEFGELKYLTKFIPEIMTTISPNIRSIADARRVYEVNSYATLSDRCATWGKT